MKVDKIKGTYNDYKVEMSFGQLQALKSALERDHADPVSDELYAELCWYLDHIPGPGEEKDDLKARDEMGADITKDGKGEEEGGGDYPLPMPPGHDDMGAAPGLNPGGEGEEPPMGGDEGGEGGDAGGLPAPDESGSSDGEGPVPGEDLEGDEGGLPKPPAE